jgi:hypothetical protein
VRCFSPCRVRCKVPCVSPCRVRCCSPRIICRSPLHFHY